MHSDQKSIYDKLTMGFEVYGSSNDTIDILQIRENEESIINNVDDLFSNDEIYKDSTSSTLENIKDINSNNYTIAMGFLVDMESISASDVQGIKIGFKRHESDAVSVVHYNIQNTETKKNGVGNINRTEIQERKFNERRFKNKVSAKESRKRRAEYLENIEKKLEIAKIEIEELKAKLLKNNIR